MIHLRISRRILYRLGWVVNGVAFLAVCYGLGSRFTPRDALGQPLLLSPSVHAAEGYRRAVVAWAARLAQADHRLTALLTQEEVTDPALLYDLSQEVQDLVDQTTAVEQDIALTRAPSALVGLAEQSHAASEAYLQAALAAARWVGAPGPGSRRAALEALRQARGLRITLEASRWLANGG